MNTFVSETSENYTASNAQYSDNRYDLLAEKYKYKAKYLASKYNNTNVGSETDLAYVTEQFGGDQYPEIKNDIYKYKVKYLNSKYKVIDNEMTGGFLKSQNRYTPADIEKAKKDFNDALNNYQPVLAALDTAKSNEILQANAVVSKASIYKNMGKEALLDAYNTLKNYSSDHPTLSSIIKSFGDEIKPVSEQFKDLTASATNLGRRLSSAGNTVLSNTTNKSLSPNKVENNNQHGGSNYLKSDLVDTTTAQVVKEVFNAIPSPKNWFGKKTPTNVNSKDSKRSKHITGGDNLLYSEGDSILFNDTIMN